MGGYNFRRSSKRDTLVAKYKAMQLPCALCGKPINYNLSWWTDPTDGKRKRHPYSFELDEITPLAHFPEHERRAAACDPRNVQPAHRICNQRKGAARKANKKQEARQKITHSRQW